MDTEYPRKIVHESLRVNHETVFDPKGNLEIGNLKNINYQ